MTSRTHSPNPEAERLLPTASAPTSSSIGDDDEAKAHSRGLGIVPTQTDRLALAFILVRSALARATRGLQTYSRS